MCKKIARPTRGQKSTLCMVGVIWAGTGCAQVKGAFRSFDRACEFAQEFLASGAASDAWVEIVPAPVLP
jgi:hypothetical protein